MKLKLNGKPFELRPLTPAVQRLIKVLNSLPADELLTAPSVMKQANIGSCTLSRALTLPELQSHTAIVGKNRYWGSKAAITEILRQVKL